MDMNSNMMNPSAMYGIPPCSGTGCPQTQTSTPVTITTPTPGNPNLPSLEEIANYNYLNAFEKQRQRQQLQEAGNEQLDQLRNPISAYPPPPSFTPGSGGTLTSGATQGGSLVSPPNQGGTLNQLVPSSSPISELEPITPTTQPAPITAESLQYMNGFLRTQVGRIIQVQFLIGTNTIVERMGILLAVGANYILINEIETDDILACDFYNIKFIRFYY